MTPGSIVSWLRTRREPEAPDPGEHATLPPARDVAIVPVSPSFNFGDEFFSESDLPEEVCAPVMSPPDVVPEAMPAPALAPRPQTISPQLADGREFTSPADSISIADLTDNSERDVAITPVSRSFDIHDKVFSEPDPPELRAPATPPPDEVPEAITAPAPAPRPQRISPRPPDGHEFMSPADSISVADLMDNSVPVDWREAVAIARRICQRVAPQSGHEYRLEPRHVELTERGEVLVLPGEPGGDPLVKQVGRILRALLDGSNAPVQLRLLASQAAFELPGFDSVEDLSAALAVFEGEGNDDPILTAFRRGREAKFSVSAEVGGRLEKQPFTPVLRAASAEPAWPPIAPPTHSTGSRRYVAAAVAVTLMVLAALAFLLRDVSDFSRQAMAWMSQPTTAPAAAARTEDVQALPSEGFTPVVELPAPEVPIRQSRPQADETTRIAPGTTARADAARTGEPAVAPNSTKAGNPIIAPPSAAVSVEAGALADSIGKRDPDVARSTVDVVPSIEGSSGPLLLANARPDYIKAQTALAQGDYDQALIEAGRLAKMLEASENNAPSSDLRAAYSDLRDAVGRLMATALDVKAREEQRIYTLEDDEVTPPVALGRQLPAAPPVGVRKQLVGHLEMLINREGEVEALKLHTPLNRFHERMIVSAAKAWRYQPARRNGKPVRFRLVSSINLPES